MPTLDEIILGNGVAVDTSADDTRRSSLYGAVRENPDAYGKAVRLSRDTGTPAPVVARNLPTVEQQAQFNAIDAAIIKGTALDKHMQNPDFAGLSHDDVTNLNELEASVNPRVGAGKIDGPAFRRQAYATSNVQPDASVSSIASGLSRTLPLSLETARQGLRAQFADVFGFEGMSQDALRRGGQARFERDTSTPNFETATASGVYGGASSLVQQSPAIVASVLSGSVIPGLLYAGTQSETDAYVKYRNRGASGGMAALGAVGEGGVEVATELLPMSFMVNRLGKAGAGEFIKGLLGREIPGEQVATLAQDAIDTAIANPDKTWSDYAKERPAAAYQTLVATVTQAGAMGAVNTAVQRMAGTQAQAETAEAHATVLDQLSKLSVASKVRPRDVESFEQFVQSASAEGPIQDVYVSVESLQQAGIDPAALAEVSPAAASQLMEAAATGGDIVIPVSEYAGKIAGSPIDQALLPHLRTSEDAMSMDDAQRYYQTQEEALRTAAQQLMTERADDTAYQASAKQIEDELFNRIKSAGRFNDDVSRANATLARDFYLTTAERIGVTPEEMFARYPLQVRGESVLSEQTLNQPTQTLDDVRKSWEASGVTTDITEGKDGISLDRIELPYGERNKGKGTQAMQLLIDYADATGQQIKLRASRAYGGDKARLVDFYTRLGFTPVNRAAPAKSARDTVMVRKADTSKLSDQTLNQPGTPAFDKWFGDSKVVDASGKPIVVYHGRSGDFDAFNTDGRGKTSGTGSFFSSSPDVAATYTGGTGNAANIAPTYLSLKNPLVVTASGQNWNALGKGTKLDLPAAERADEDEALLAELEGRAPDANATVKTKAKTTTLGKLFPREFNYSDGFSTDDVAAWARKQGFDGVIFRSVKDRGPTGQFYTEASAVPSDLYVAFNPNQIKSAIGNNGEYDPNNPSILAQGTNDANDTTGSRAGSDRSQLPAEQNVPTTLSGGNPREGWADATRVRSTTGQPAFVYRGAGRPLSSDDFGQSALGAASGNPSSGLGVWFTASRSEAGQYGDVSDYQLDLRKPKVIMVEDLPGFDSVADASAFAKDLAAQGYDGIAVDARPLGGPLHLVAFDPETVIVPPAAQPLDMSQFFQGASSEATGTSEFQEWAGTDRPVIEPDEINDFDFKGEGPFVVKAYHGTTNTFDEFDASVKGNVEGQFGSVNYFTSSEADASANYAGEGPDLTSRIETLRERLAQEYESDVEDGTDADDLAAAINNRYNIDLQALDIPRVDNELDGDIDPYALADVVAQRVLHGGDEIVMEVYVRTEKPFVVDGSNSPLLDLVDYADIENRAIEQVAENSEVTADEVRADPDTYQDEVDDARYQIMDETDNPLVDAVNTVANRYDFDPAELLGELYEITEDGRVDHGRLEQFMRASDSLQYVERPDDGALIQSQIIGEVIQEMGFDSIILKDANQRFRNMNMPNGTAHIHVFDANNTNIKSVDNQGTFDRTDPNIYLQPEAAQGGNRGEISFGKDVTQTPSVITLFKDADLSTFLHEMGHFQLEVLMHIATQPNAPQGVVDDVNAALNWFKPGMTAAEWQAMSLDEKRPYHEQFARGFEAYLFEGKAPNQELQSLFQRLRSWMIAAYKSMANLNVEISDDIRQVFNRLIATDAAIEASEAARNMAPLFATQESMGATPAEWDAYQSLGREATQDAQDALQARSMRDMQWLTNARNRVLKQLQKEADSKRKEMTAEVKAEVRAMPVYAAQHFLRRGEMFTPDGEFIKVDKGHKLDTPTLKEMYPEGMLARPDLEGLRGMTRRDGLHPDLVAEMFGYTSGDQLVREILAAAPEAEMVEGLTDQRMIERYGDLTDANAVERAADEAIHNEARAKFVAAELAAVTKTQAPARVIQRAAKAFAETMIARKKIRDIKPNQHAAAEARAAKNAEKALKASDLPTVASEKRNQLVQNYATRTAYDALAEVEKGVTYMKGLNTPAARKRIDAGYTDQIDMLLEQFDLRAVSNKDAAKRERLADWIENQKAMGLEPEIPQQLLEDAGRKPYREMTLEEFRGLVDTVKQIDHLGRLKNKLLTAKDQREFATATREISMSIEANAGDRTAETRTPENTLGRLAASLRRFWASHIKAATWARVLDGGNDGGPMWEYFIRTANERGDMETQQRSAATTELSNILTPIVKSWPKSQAKGTYFPSVERAFTREGAMVVALNTGNDGNIQRLLGGENWTIEQIQPVLDSLTAQEWRAVQAVWDHFESYRPEIAAKERRLYGKEPTWVEPVAREATAADGTKVPLRGGYYPIKYDPAASQRAEEHADAEQAKRQLQGAYTAATTRRGFTKQRAEEVTGRPLLYSMVGIYSGVNDVVHDLAWHEWLIDANRLLRAQNIDNAIRSHYGPEVKAQFKQWVSDVAQGETRADHPSEVGVSWLRQGVSAAGLGFNVMSALMQVTGIAASIARVTPAYIGRGVSQYVANPRRVTREVIDKSLFMADRSRTQFRELNELRNTVEGQTAVKRAMTLGTYFMMMRMQRMVDVPTWVGAYEKAIAEGNNEERSIALSDQAVIDSQGSGMLKDLSAIERGGQALKLFTVFYSYMNTMLNLGTGVAMTEKSKGQLAAKMAMIYVAPAVLGFAIKNALTPSGGDDDDELWQQLLAEQLSFMMGLMVGVREFAEVGKIVAGIDKTYDYSGPAGTRLASDAIKFGQQLSKAEFDAAFRKASINLLGDLTGAPAAQINRTINGIEALSEGDTENPAAVVLGFKK